MALFEYFPNYIWNLSVAIALENGGKIGEIVDMCQPIKDAANNGADAGTAQFLKEWVKVADRLVELAEEDLENGREFSAGPKLKRASIYYVTAERMQGHGHPGRMQTYQKALAAFERGTKFARDNIKRVEIPYADDKKLSGLLTLVDGNGPHPLVIFCNGLDSCKEMLWLGGFPYALAKRGISSLCVDQPGTGEALRFEGLPATYASEQWASTWLDWLEQQPFVDAKHIGITGISLGGHYAPRAVAFEPRFASGACWGANHNWAEVQQKRLKHEGENPVPHYWQHVMWVFGAKDMDEFFEKAAGMNLNGVMDRIKVPFLVTHGAHDRQISVDYAHQSHEQLVNSPNRQLKIFTEREGGVEHVGADNMSFGTEYMADWFAETLGGHTR